VGPNPQPVRPVKLAMANTRRRGGGREDTASNAPSQRMLRVGELVRHKLAEMLSRGEVHDDVLQSHVITIPEVRMSPDLRLATVYVMPLGGKDVLPVISALDRHKRFIRGEVAHTLNLKFAPEVRFRQDASFDEASRIDRLLDSDKVKRDVGRG
jgi:ribosome-binding factor A